MRCGTAITIAAGVTLAILPVPSARAGEWEGVRPGVTSLRQLRDRLGEPLAEYPDSAIFRGPRGVEPIRVATVVANLRPGEVVESLILFPEWGVTSEDVREALGEGQMMTYAEFLKTTGRRVVGAGERPDTKLHYLTLDTHVELFKKMRVLVAYDERDITSGADVVKLIVYY